VKGYTVSGLEEIEEFDDGRCPYRPVRHHLGIRAFGVTAWTAREAGDQIINEHDEDDEDGQEELYVVTAGRATFTLDGTDVDAPAGTLVFVQPGSKRTAFAVEAQTTILAVGGTAGKAYEPAGWELWAPANPAFQSGDYERAIELVRPVVDEHPHYAGLVYNLACAESLAGRTDDAIEHLGRAVALSDRFASFAQGDSDLDAIRDDPRFSAITGQT
jgi:tetratricopeptide (TPR) repeat protein